MTQPTPDDQPSRARFEQIYGAHHAAITAYVVRRAAQPHDAADAVAETFLVAWRRIAVVPAGDDARLWLYGVARRVLADQRRSHRRRDALAATLGAQLREDLVELTDTFAALDRPSLARAFGSLSDADRELLSLVGWEGLDHAQIATVLGCSRNAVRIRLHRARVRFARSLDHEAVEPTGSRPAPSPVPNGASS